MQGMDNFFWHIIKLHQSVIENKKKITVAIRAPVSGLMQWIRAFVTLRENNFQNLQTLQPKYETFLLNVFRILKSNPYIYLSQSSVFHKLCGNSKLKPLFFKDHCVVDITHDLAYKV